jgi:signal transduction histidine kinase
MRNIVENALKYGIEGSVVVTLSKHTLCISNTIDTDISPISLQKIFQPFYKIDESRSTPGYGL